MRAHIVTPANKHLYTAQLDQMHRQRRKLFVEQRRWTALDNGSAYEIDEFDHDAAVYLLALGDVGEVLGSARLIPTWRPHLFDNVLTHYLDEPATAKGPGVWEYSRWAPGDGRDRDQDAASRALLLCATAEFAVAHQVEAYVACIETRFLNIFSELNWPVQFLGTVKRYETGKAVAVRFTLGMKELVATRSYLGHATPSAIELPAWLPDRPTDPLSFSVIDEILGIEDEGRRRQALSYCVQVAAAEEVDRSGEKLGALLYATARGNA